MKIIEHISASGASEAEICALERRLGVVLPSDYREFLKDSNGGRPMPNTFEGPNGDGSRVHFFFTLDPDETHYRLHDEIETYTDRIPDKMLPIASDDFGNIVLLDIGATSPGAIYFWEHEEENLDGDPYWDNVAFIAPSFADFVEGLF